MIPIIVITENGESFNYFSGRLRNVEVKGLNSDDNKYRIEHELTGIAGLLNGIDEIYEQQLIVFEHSNSQFLDKVLEILHEEVSGCFHGLHESNWTDLRQHQFQIYLKHIIQKAEEKIKL